MPTPIPLNQSSENILLALINRDNNSVENLETISLGLPADYSDGGKNSKTIVSALPNSGRSGTVEMYYNRLFLSDLFIIETLPIPFGVYGTTLDVVSYLNTTYNLMLSEDDIVNNVIEGTTATLVTNSSSFIWKGSLNIEIKPEGLDIPPGTYLNLGDGSLFSLADNVLHLLGE